jgi:hypothetical protein
MHFIDRNAMPVFPCAAQIKTGEPDPFMDMIEESRRIYKGFVKPTTSPDPSPITAAHKFNTSSRLPGLFDCRDHPASRLPSSRGDRWRNIVRPMPQNWLIFIKLCSRTRQASSATEGNPYVRDQA